ncbi:hypothetical protein [Streptomyces sp. UG1]|uniref:hypothetical protein n=1 Tax=Streptomyces sp. UG1 TaxID=3417652 RepID=UPI003CF79E60
MFKYNHTTGNTPGKSPCCHFCTDRGAAWAYPAETFTRRLVDGVHVVLDGPWRACTACHRLIEADTWAKLRRRSLAFHRAVYGPLTPAEDIAIAADLAPLWMAFRARRTGPAERIGGVV